MLNTHAGSRVGKKQTVHSRKKIAYKESLPQEEVECEKKEERKQQEKKEEREQKDKIIEVVENMGVIYSNNRVCSLNSKTLEDLDNDQQPETEIEMDNNLLVFKMLHKITNRQMINSDYELCEKHINEINNYNNIFQLVYKNYVKLSMVFSEEYRTFKELYRQFTNKHKFYFNSININIL